MQRVKKSIEFNTAIETFHEAVNRERMCKTQTTRPVSKSIMQNLPNTDTLPPTGPLFILHLFRQNYWEDLI
jgi:hypothetical protein